MPDPFDKVSAKVDQSAENEIGARQPITQVKKAWKSWETFLKSLADVVNVGGCAKHQMKALPYSKIDC